MLRTALITMASLMVTYATWAHAFSHTRPAWTPHTDWQRCENHPSPSDKELDTPRYSRVVVLSQDYVWPGPTIPLDPNHQAMIASGLYTPAEAEAMTEAAIGDLLTKYGVDFRLSNPNVELEPATGVRTLDGLAIFLPTVIGANEQFFLVEDTKYPERARTHRWFEVEYGHIVLFTSSGTFTSGTNAGATYEANDLFSYGEINLLKKGADWQKKHNREVIKFRTSNLTKQSTNQWGISQFNIVLDLLDEEGREGLYLAATAILKEPVVTGTNFLKERPVMTWTCPAPE
jgi:hypothetical protein